MKTDRRKRAAAGEKQRHEERHEKADPGHEDGESCRCKEVSKKSISELLKVAVSDLSFWKKTK